MAVDPKRKTAPKRPKKPTYQEERMQKRLSDGFTGKIKMKLKKGKK